MFAEKAFSGIDARLQTAVCNARMEGTAVASYSVTVKQGTLEQPVQYLSALPTVEMGVYVSDLEFAPALGDFMAATAKLQYVVIAV